MAILSSCCCYKSLRKGSYASAIYTLIYFSITLLLMVQFFFEEEAYYSGKHPVPTSISFLEPEVISHTTMVFHLLIMLSSLCGVITSAVLIFAIYSDIKVFLIPWILTVFMAIIIELAHTVYLISLPSTTFRPVTAFTFTVAFFTFCLNSYSLMCVISLYQEYKVGRGTAHYETVARLAAMQHMAAIQATATATSVLSTKRNVTYHVSPPRSPDEGGGARKNSAPRKHVQFISAHPQHGGGGGRKDEEKLHAHWSVAENELLFEKEPKIWW
uniref:Uncharacterized protein n=1 Tax=Cacopsylla melanoneura TaxID=428564 RepID=A0A8D8VQQ6_9HEMI